MARNRKKKKTAAELRQQAVDAQTKVGEVLDSAAVNPRVTETVNKHMEDLAERIKKMKISGVSVEIIPVENIPSQPNRNVDNQQPPQVRPQREGR